MRVLSFLLLLGIAAPLAAQPSDLSPGIALYNARRWTEAHAFFASATKAQPRNLEAVIWYGRTLLSQGKPGDAVDWFEKATKLAPLSSEAHLWLGRAIGVQAATANVLRQPFLARRLKHTVDRAIELDPESIDARELRWRFYLMAPAVMGGGEAHARAEAAEVLKRNRYRGLQLIASTANRAKDFVTAERHYKTAVVEHPDSIGVASVYAAWLADRDRPTEAFAVIDAYEKRHPTDPQSLFQVGRLSATTGLQLERGDAALRKYLAAPPPPALHFPSLSVVHLRLGNIAERRGNTPAARAAYEQALKLDPRSNQARRALEGLR
ncbi:MAG: tetratricopeptide repeat protein [Gemmatimonadaceae bacterium]|nr:tetratricopeptide repeat protein [Gemmatimonadaceae bacterium]